jgi:peroxiredoxin Q/BCP
VAQKKAPKKTKKAAAPKAAPPPRVGSRAPAFTLLSDTGERVSLADLRGKRVVLYFYPKDDTPGCTVEACGFRDLHTKLAARGAVVVGISRDSIARHQRFKEKHDLPFMLLSDPDAETIAAYGSWGEKKFMGRTSVGTLRTTVLIGADGKVEKVYSKVRTKEHAKEVLDDLTR